jgi:GNAT superfamily N-acetyltransferase
MKILYCLLILLIGVVLVMKYAVPRQPQIYQIRTRHYLDEIAALINEAYKKVDWLKDSVKRTTIDELATIVDHPDKALYACFDGNTLCATAVLDRADEKDKLMLEMFSVHPHYQGKNIGTYLLHFLEQEAVHTFNISALYLYVVPCAQERLIAYYQRHGFEIVTEKPYTLLKVVKPEYHDQMSLLLMRKSLLSAD